MVEKERVVQDFVKHALKAALKCTELEICTPRPPPPPDRDRNRHGNVTDREKH
jgi:hypothetical protein